MAENLISGGRRHESYGAIPGSSGILEVEVDGGGGCVRRLYPAGFRNELKAVLRLAFPMILTQASQYLIGPVALMFCGHLGDIPLAAVALANSFISISALTIANGMASACDTLFSQVYGSCNRKRLGVYLQRSLQVLVLTVLPCWAVHMNTEPILLILGQDPLVSRLAGRYLLFFMPGVLFYFIFLCLAKYVQNQNLVIPTVVVGGLANGLNALLHYLVVIVGGYGIEGSSICQVVSYFSMMVLILLYILVSKVYKETWEGWSWSSLQEWGEFYRLGTFGLIMYCIEAWSFEIGIITAGLLGTSYLSSMSVIFQLETMAFMLPLGTGIAASIRVGQYLGAGNSDGAQTAARVAMTFICGVELIVAILFASLRNYLPQMFTNVPEVIEMVSQVLPVCAVYQLSDGLAGTGAGILRGQGRQNLGAAIIMGGYLMALTVGTPLMLYTWLRLYAFWGGLAVALTIEGIMFALIIHLNNWERQAQRALRRVRVKSEGSDEYGGLFIDNNVAIDQNMNQEKEALLDAQGDVVEMSTHKPKVSSSLGDSRYPESETSTDSVIIPRRILITAVFVGIFLVGLFVRVFYTNYLPEYVSPTVDVANTTAGYDVTQRPTTVESQAERSSLSETQNNFFVSPSP